MKSAQHHTGGWVDVAAKLNLPLAARPLHRIDPFPYQHRIGEMMLKNPLIMPPEATAGEAAAAMKTGRIDCIFVGSGPDQYRWHCVRT